MGDFYGYNAAQFKPDNSFWGEALGEVGKMVSKLPEVIKMDQDIAAGKIQTSDIYDSIKSEISGIEDSEFKTYYSMDKKTFLNIAKPGSEEQAHPDKFKIRAVELMKPYLAIAAKKNISSAQNEIGAINQQGASNFKAQQEFMGPLDPSKEIGAIGGPIAPRKQATPEDVQRIASKNNTTTDFLKPEMTEATNARTSQQIGKIDPSGTQIGAYQAIGGGATPEAEKAIGSLNDQYQEGQSIVFGANANANKVNAEADARDNRSKNTNMEVDNYTNLKKITLEAINNKQLRLNQLKDDYERLSANPEDKEKTDKEIRSITRELTTKRKEEENINSRLNELSGLKLKEGGIEDDVIDAYNIFTSKAAAENEPPEVSAIRLQEMAKKDWGVTAESAKIAEYLKSGVSLAQLMQVIYDERQNK